MHCGICGDRVPFHAPCVRAHDGLCHWCAEANWSGALLDNPAHDAPPEGRPLPPPVCEVLEAATAAALDAYAAHVQRTEAASMRRLLRAHGEED